MSRLGIFGTSGHAREVCDIALAVGYDVTFIARDQTSADSTVQGGALILEEDVEQMNDAVFAIGIGDNTLREAVASRFGERLRFANLVHPAATLGCGQTERMRRSRGIVVAAGARISSNVDIGDFVVVGANAVLSHDCVIDAFAMVAPGATVLGNVVAGARSWIGAGATIVQGSSILARRIGAGAVIGAGAAVTEDCEPDGVYVGVPARRVR